jgi:hypothetical protein
VRATSVRRIRPSGTAIAKPTRLKRYEVEWHAKVQYVSGLWPPSDVVYVCRVAGKKAPLPLSASPAPPSPLVGTASSPSNRRSGCSHLALSCDDHEPRWAQVAASNRPAFVPRTTGRGQEMTGTTGASNPHVRKQIRPSPQLERSAPRTLSRWRHGFKSRWDYAGQRGYPGVHEGEWHPLAPRRARRPTRTRDPAST